MFIVYESTLQSLSCPPVATNSSPGDTQQQLISLKKIIDDLLKIRFNTYIAIWIETLLEFMKKYKI